MEPKIEKGVQTPENASKKERKERKKTRRINLVTYQDTYDKLEKILTMQRRKSLNEFFTEMMEEYISEHEDLLQKYDEVFGDPE